MSIEDPNLCQRYIAVIVKDVQIRESPQWMKDRLDRAGVRPVNNVVDVTNYVMLEWGQPLHAFDYRMLATTRRRRTDRRRSPCARRSPAKR